MTTDKAIHKFFDIQQNDILPIVTGGSARREDLAVFMGKAGFKYGAEIGVWIGDYSEVLFKNIPVFKLLCVDPWCAYTCSNGFQTNEKAAEIAYECIQKRLRKHNVQYMRMTSMEAVQKVEDESLDFVYIDAQHMFDFIMTDLIFWSNKVKTGGIVAGRAYFAFPGNSVMTAVNAYTYAHSIFSWYVMRDHEPTFFWVKP